MHKPLHNESKQTNFELFLQVIKKDEVLPPIY